MFSVRHFRFIFKSFILRVSEMASTSLTDSEAAFRKQAAHLGLAQDWIDGLVAINVNNLGKLAFACSQPGQPATDAEVQQLLNNTGAVRMVTVGDIAILKRMIFEAQTAVISLVRAQSDPNSDPSARKLPAAERNARIEVQRLRLRGMALEGPLEVAHCVYDTISGMMESDSLKYVPPSKCLARLAEITAAKPPKELKLDANATGIIVKDSAVDASCPTSTEMDIFEALTRRALAFDAVGLIAFDVADKWHRYMFQLTRQQPPPGFKQPGMTQLLRADRQAFVRMQELSRDGIRPLADGTRPLDRIVQELEKDHSVVYYLLPTPLPVKDKVEKQPNPKKEDTWGGHYRKHGDVKKWNDKNQWKGQGKSRKWEWQASMAAERVCICYRRRLSHLLRLQHRWLQ